MDDACATDQSPGEEEFLVEVREKFELAATRERLNREEALNDLRFARLGEQWPESVRRQRDLEARPCLTINRLPAFIRQVVNDARQNKPGITVHPADSHADVATAHIIEGLIRNIEVTSDADVAYDTALESAVTGGFGYFRINTRYASDDSFDQDIVIERIANPFTVYGDPYSEAADSSDWNCAFVATQMSRDAFAAKYKGKQAVDWDGLGYRGLPSPWMDGDQIMVCEYWRREVVESRLVALSNGESVGADIHAARAAEWAAAGIVAVGAPRIIRTHKVTQYLLSGAELLETVEWPGRYIPIVPVYGEEVNIEGERHFRSLVRDAKDAQQEHNYWRSTAAETIALAPRAPFIGPVGAFKTAINKWNRVNDSSQAFIEYDGPIAPQRQGFTGPDVGAMQQALAASDDMKAIMGLYDASLGQRSNETSGVAIGARQRQGNVATFHFIDNLTRAIRHAGRILIDLIPSVYSTERVIRVLGEDMKPAAHRIGPAMPQAQPLGQQQGAQEEGQAAIARIYDLGAGKYDLTVKAGPPFASQREAARAEIVEIIRSVPGSAAVLGPMYLRNSDWVGAEQAANRIEQAAGGAAGGGDARLQALAQENAALKQELAGKQAEREIKAREVGVKMFEAETERMRVQMGRVK